MEKKKIAQAMSEKLEYICLDLEQIPETLKYVENINFKPNIGIEENKYRQYRFVSPKELEILLSPCNRLEDTKTKYSKAKPLVSYLEPKTEEEKEFELHTKLNSGNTNEEDNGYNAKYMDVRNFVLIEQKASTTLIQRKFKIGYGKAANYMDMLEDEGIVGPENGSKGREVLMTFEEWEAKNESENN